MASSSSPPAPLDAPDFSRMLDALEAKGDLAKTTTESERKMLRSVVADPAMVEELRKYMASIASPEAREEQDAMIAQAEALSQVPAGKRLVRPEPWFALAARTKHGERIYVNVVSAADCDDMSVTGGAFQFPHFVGPWNYEHDVDAVARAGGRVDGVAADVRTLDVCFSSGDTRALATRDARVRKLVEETALEARGASSNAMRHTSASRGRPQPYFAARSELKYGDDTPTGGMKHHKVLSPYAASQVSGCSLCKASKPLYAVTLMQTAEGSSGLRPSSKW